MVRDDTKQGTSVGVESRLRLQVYREGNLHTHHLKGVRWKVGRAEDCDITLQDPAVSRHHLVLEREDDLIHFRDLGGTNAIVLDGRRVREGVFPDGGTMVVGGTRIILEKLSSTSRVRVVPEAKETVILNRQYLEEGCATEGEGVAARAEILERLFCPLSEAGSSEEMGLRLLEFALDLTQRQQGVLGVFDPLGRMSVVASCDREAVGRDLRVPETVLLESRTAPRPFLRSTRNGSRVDEWLVVPLEPDPRGVLILEAGLPNAPSGQACLRLAKALGQIVTCRLHETRSREQLRGEIQRLRFHRTPAHATILASTRLHPLRRDLRQAAGHDLPVLLVGEEGTEKEDLARYVHAQSRRNQGPFVPFHHGVLPTHRVEEELFGKPGAQADGRPGGALLRAGGGTLYIEGLDRLPEQVQSRLLYILAEGVCQVDGEVVPVDVRMVGSVADRPTESSGMLDALREEFSGIQIEIAPLRGHSEDIGSLAELILSEMGPGPDGTPRILTDGAKRRFLDYRWPGNVRQLRMVLEAAAARSGQQPIAERHLPAEVREPTQADEAGLVRLEDVEKQHIRRVLEALGGNRAKAAKVLGIATSTLYEKMKRFALGG